MKKESAYQMIFGKTPQIRSQTKRGITLNPQMLSNSLLTQKEQEQEKNN